MTIITYLLHSFRRRIRFGNVQNLQRFGFGYLSSQHGRCRLGCIDAIATSILNGLGIRCGNGPGQDGHERNHNLCNDATQWKDHDVLCIYLSSCWSVVSNRWTVKDSMIKEDCTERRTELCVMALWRYGYPCDSIDRQNGWRDSWMAYVYVL
jgi:hypothetical protein